MQNWKCFDFCLDELPGSLHVVRGCVAHSVRHVASRWLWEWLCVYLSVLDQRHRARPRGPHRVLSPRNVLHRTRGFRFRVSCSNDSFFVFKLCWNWMWFVCLKSNLLCALPGADSTSLSADSDVLLGFVLRQCWPQTCLRIHQKHVQRSVYVSLWITVARSHSILIGLSFFHGKLAPLLYHCHQ